MSVCDIRGAAYVPMFTDTDQNGKNQDKHFFIGSGRCPLRRGGASAEGWALGASVRIRGICG
ncbi:hypothetical protein CBW46_009255 [Paenibacillus xerothermodurans]|uniref:Uncharacterized protein n=1 Tax=Paenibacillus xerothermodurans TaxID=1977292 RepID=A0A2W1NEJ9_PAEXE|nr:hypothetical protein CBW46_009255 [Paenibacillus xerothermodurans]